jgi:hypothetical protein
MGLQQIQARCGRCERLTLHNQTTPNHVAHLIGTLITAGLWIVIWLIVAVSKSPAKCVQCGTANKV